MKREYVVLGVTSTPNFKDYEEAFNYEKKRIPAASEESLIRKVDVKHCLPHIMKTKDEFLKKLSKSSS